MAINSGPENSANPITYEGMYAVNLIGLADQLEAGARFAVIYGDPNQVVLGAGAQLLRQEVYQSFSVPKARQFFPDAVKKKVVERGRD